MIKKSLPNKVLILGSGALQIGQAGEFDYSGSQAIKALKEDNAKTVLINPNIATIQTSEHFADKIYFLPVEPYFIEKVIEKEKPDGIFLGFGGQTALNAGLKLYQSGILQKHKVEILGTSAKSILITEDRKLFADAVRKSGFKTPKSIAAHNLNEALAAIKEIKFPAMVRIAFALGGLGSGIVQDENEFIDKCKKAFAYTDQILIEECLYGWKEIEFEIIRDKYDNCLTICSMENLDPMGIHTGDSVVIAPAQTLSAREVFMLRSIAIKFARDLNIIGECNIQYALDPNSEDYRIIEVNPRLSRSSALASKATGYPLAYVAAKLALGYNLNEIPNLITKATSSCFEPALDYVAIKFPRWDLQKFRGVKSELGSEMKSVGEVMSIGRCFEEAFQKAFRMLDIGLKGFVGNKNNDPINENEIRVATDKRYLKIAKALDENLSPEKISELSKIDKWFVYKMKNIVDFYKELKNKHIGDIDKDFLLQAKRYGFSDLQIAEALGVAELDIRKLRKTLGVLPSIKQIDSLAAEFPAKTNYLYATYLGIENDVEFNDGENKVVILGSGAYRIGSSVEFDWCSVNAAFTLRKLGYKAIMINCNPETVSTDHDICDKLYFEEISLERVLDIIEYEKPLGVIVSMGGQLPNNLAKKLDEYGVKIIGPSPKAIEKAEDRKKFSQILDRLGILQPEWDELTSLDAAKEFAKKVGYPVVIRPSFVLSGASMGVALNEEELENYFNKAAEISKEHPAVINKFIEDAKEIEIDAVANEGELFCYAISEHVENAGVHSGDATLALPPQRTYLETLRRAKIIAKKIAKALAITGPFNIQFIAKDNNVSVIECNLRASRSFPFVSKTLKINFIDIAVRLMMKEKVLKIDKSAFELDYVGVKASQFSFTRLRGSDPTLNIEMTSTGEVGCLGDDFHEAFLKSLISVGFKIPKKGVLLSTGYPKQKADLLEAVKIFQKLGLKLYGTDGSASYYNSLGIEVEPLYRPFDNREPSIMKYLEDGKIDLAINIPKTIDKEELDSDYLIRRKVVDLNISLITNVQFAKRFAKAILKYSKGDLLVKSWDEYGLEFND